MKPQDKGMVSLKVSELEQKLPWLLEKKLAEKKSNEIFVDGCIAGIEKVFGNAELTQAIILKNIKASESAKAAIEKAKGKVEEEKFETKEKTEKKPQENSAKPIEKKEGNQ
jgi:ribosomal protein L15